MTSGVLLL